MSTALVLLSGGQDSATCAAWAAARFERIECLSFFYGQKHRRELEAAERIAALFRAPWRTVDIPALYAHPSSSLTNSKLAHAATAQGELPVSFVPGRNLIFLTTAASLALGRGIADIVTGVCQTDYSGYPDCRADTISALERALKLGNAGFGRAADLRIHTPLMELTKAQTVKMARELPKGWEALAMSWTCYEGGAKPCGECPACELRKKGFAEAGETDPA
ncbi:MAG: 7-cyano-7-deazaguanine synthase QueC [Bacteriovoracia bacterium]